MAWAPDYCTTDELCEYARIGDSQDNPQVALAAAAASRAIDRGTGRQFGVVASPEARVYTAEWDRNRCRYVVKVDDFMTTTGLAIAFDLDDDQTYEASLVSGDWRLWPFDADKRGRPWERLIINLGATYQPNCREAAVQVTATWGWTDVPNTIVQAALLQGSRLINRRESPWGIAGSPAVGGGELRLLERVDPDVAVMIRTFARTWGAV